MFFEKNLAELVDTASSPWAWRPGSSMQNAPGGALVQFERARKIKDTFFATGGKVPSVSFELTPITMDPTITQFVLDTVDRAGANACPPIIVGVGIGGTFENAALLAKKAVLRPLDLRNRRADIGQLEAELLERVNELGIGPQGLGGRITALGVNIEVHPTHIAGLPVAVNLGCHSTRRISTTL